MKFYKVLFKVSASLLFHHWYLLEKRILEQNFIYWVTLMVSSSALPNILKIEGFALLSMKCKNGLLYLVNITSNTWLYYDWSEFYCKSRILDINRDCLMILRIEMYFKRYSKRISNKSEVRICLKGVGLSNLSHVSSQLLQGNNLFIWF